MIRTLFLFLMDVFPPGHRAGNATMRTSRFSSTQTLPIDFGPSNSQVLRPQTPSGVSNGGSGSSVGRFGSVWAFELCLLACHGVFHRGTKPGNATFFEFLSFFLWMFSSFEVHLPGDFAPGGELQQLGLPGPGRPGGAPGAVGPGPGARSVGWAPKSLVGLPFLKRGHGRSLKVRRDVLSFVLGFFGQEVHLVGGEGHLQRFICRSDFAGGRGETVANTREEGPLPEKTREMFRLYTWGSIHFPGWWKYSKSCRSDYPSPTKKRNPGFQAKRRSSNGMSHFGADPDGF